MSDLFTRSRTVIIRSWREIEPKLAVGLISGSATGFALDLAAQNRLVISPTWQHFIVVGGFFLGGFIKSSSFPTIEQVEAELPQAEAVAKKIIHPPLPDTNTHPVKIVPSDAKLSMSNLTAKIESEDDKATQVLTPGASFLNTLPSAQNNPLKDV